MHLTFENGSQQTLSQFALKFNVNYVGVSPDAPLRVSPISPGGAASTLLPLNTSGECASAAKPGVVQCALKTDLGQVCYFQANLPAYLLFEESGKLPDANFLRLWLHVFPPKKPSFPLPLSPLFSFFFLSVLFLTFFQASLPSRK